MGEVRVPARGQVAGPDPAGRGELPDLRAHPRARAHRGAGRDQGRRRHGERRPRRPRARTSPTRSAPRPTRWPRGDWDDALPDRRLPDRLGHVEQHEHQRGDRHAGHRGARARRCTPTTTSTPRSRPTTSSRRRSTSPRPAPSSTTSSPRCEHLEASLARKATEFATVVKSGRTHLMDATPVTLGPGVRRLRRRRSGSASSGCEASLPRIGRAAARRHRRRHRHQHPARVLRRGSSRSVAANTGPAAHRGARPLRGAGRARRAGRGVRPAAHDRRRPVQDRPTTCAGWARARAPASREIHLPDLQPGSSIMPGKVNPVIPEALCMVCAQVIGNDAAVAFGGAAGNFELNVMLPMMARNVLESIRLLRQRRRLFADRCVDGITANVERCREYAESSPSIVTPLNKLHRLRGGGQGRQAGARRAQDDPPGRARARVRRAGQAHRGAARRGARRPAHDPPLTARRCASATTALYGSLSAPTQPPSVVELVLTG